MKLKVKRNPTVAEVEKALGFRVEEMRVEPDGTVTLSIPDDVDEEKAKKAMKDIFGGIVEKE